MSGSDRSCRQISLNPGRSTRAQELNRIRRDREINRGRAAIVEFDEIVRVGCARQSAAGIYLTDYQVGLVIILNRARALRVADICAGARVRKINEEGFV